MSWRNRRAAAVGAATAVSSAEDGFTLVEALVAATILLVGILGTAAALNITRTSVNRSEVRESAAHRAQRELERVRALPYASIGLAAAPTPSADPADPDSAVRANGTYAWHDGDASKAEPLVTGGALTTERTFDDGRLKGTLHLYVTAYDDPAVTAPVAARRVTVAVVPARPWTLARPVVASTVVAAPPS